MSDDTEVKRGRGRPRIHPKPDPNAPKKKRGPKPKPKPPPDPNAIIFEPRPRRPNGQGFRKPPDPDAPKKGVGRPRTTPLPDPDKPKRGVGRPKGTKCKAHGFSPEDLIKEMREKRGAVETPKTPDMFNLDDPLEQRLRSTPYRCEQLMKRRRVFELRVAGWTFDEIAADVGMSKQGVAAMLTKEIKYRNDRCSESIADIIHISIEQINSIIKCHLPNKDDFDASKVVLSAISAKMKTLGLGIANEKKAEPLSGDERAIELAAIFDAARARADRCTGPKTESIPPGDGISAEGEATPVSDADKPVV